MNTWILWGDFKINLVFQMISHLASGSGNVFMCVVYCVQCMFVCFGVARAVYRVIALIVCSLFVCTAPVFVVVVVDVVVVVVVDDDVVVVVGGGVVVVVVVAVVVVGVVVDVVVVAIAYCVLCLTYLLAHRAWTSGSEPGSAATPATAAGSPLGATSLSLSLSLSLIYIYIYTHIYTYIYIYIERERESLSLSLYIYIYI